MNALPYEILFRWNDAGKFAGGHTMRRDATTGQILSPVAIGNDKEFPLPDIMKAIDEAVLSKAGEVDEVKAALKELTTKHEEVVAAFAEVDPALKRAQLEKQKETLAAQVAELDKGIAALTP